MKRSVNWKRGILGATYETPLRWLIKTMPGMVQVTVFGYCNIVLNSLDMAKRFLDVCVQKKIGKQAFNRIVIFDPHSPDNFICWYTCGIPNIA